MWNFFSRPYPLKLFKDCFPQTFFSLLLNILSQMWQTSRKYLAKKMVEANYPLISRTLTISLCVYIICQYQSWKKSPKLSKSNIRQATWYQVPYTFWPSRYCFRCRLHWKTIFLLFSFFSGFRKILPTGLPHLRQIIQKWTKYIF